MTLSLVLLCLFCLIRLEDGLVLVIIGSGIFFDHSAASIGLKRSQM